jgi:organic hydroperoxide reductase OsmC/OhrA
VATTHRYQSHLVWRGSTAAGYRGFSRAHRVVTPPAAAQIEVSADPSFRGDPQLQNPEQLLLAAASTCQLLSFLALAAQAGLDVVGYQDDAEAVMPATGERIRITQVTLRPQILVAAGTDITQVPELVDRAHDGCYIANTLNAEMVLEPAIAHAGNAVTAGHPSGTPDSGQVRT